MVGGALFGLAYVWLWFVSMGALARSVSEHYLGGTPTIWTAYSPVLRRSFSLIWVYVLIWLVGGAILGAGGGIFAGAMVIVNLLPTTAGYVMAAALGIAAVVVLAIAVGTFIRSILVTQVIVIEDVRGWAAVKRSWRLMRPCTGKAVVIFLFGIAVSFIISFLFNLPAGVVMALRPGSTTFILGKAWEGLGQILAAPLLMIAFTLLYYDSRIRQEAFDLEMMAQNLGVSKGPATSSQTNAPPRPSISRSPSPAGPPTRPAGSLPRPIAAFKVCPKCGAQVPNIQPSCGKCGTRVPYRPATHSPAP